MSGGKIPAEAREVLDFWFGLAPEQWFTTDPLIDEEISGRFGALHGRAVDGDLESWTASPEGALALVLVLDQFPRNMYRGTPAAFASDAQAREVADRAIAQKFDVKLPEEARRWFYLPFMHSEALADQERCLALHLERTPQNADGIAYARDHLDIIRRFGRFPHRNAILGRQSTDDEVAFLEAGGFSG